MTGIAISQTVITDLPGFPGPLPFKLETGYIAVGDVELFYYFVESQGDPVSDPLMLWLTGGPGCSSFSGLIYEIGPIGFDYQCTNISHPQFVLNKYSWTKVASIIFLDSPVGTGFSYATTNEAYYSSDTKLTKDAYTFLRKWFSSHPQYLSNLLYIGGDSYSGIPVPVIVEEILNGNHAGEPPYMNLAGYVLGNPLTNAWNQANSKVKYAYFLGLISRELYESAKNNCKGDYYNVDPNNNTRCVDDLVQIFECYRAVDCAMILEPACGLLTSAGIESNGRRILEDPPVEFLQSIVQNRDLWCRPYNYQLSRIWANNLTVREALHVRNGTKMAWERCNTSLSFTQDVNDTVGYHKNLTRADIRVLIYSGDHDMLIPYIGTLEWIKSLNLSTIDTWRPWYVDSQVGGYTESYTCQDCHFGNYIMTFATVKGGGHTAPEYRPKEAYAMIKRWLSYYYV